MSPDCRIEFIENPWKVYYAGQMLNGAVKLKLTKPQTVRGTQSQLFLNFHLILKRSIVCSI